MKQPRVAILCGGLGMRLREEEGGHKPKAMVQVGGRPILWHILRHYEKHGFNRFVLCLGYKGDVIREYFLNYEYMNNDFTVSMDPARGRRVEVHPRAGTPAETIAWEVTLAETGATAQTGARLKKIEPYVDSDFFLCTYGDGVSNVNLRALVDYHKAHGKIATLTGVSPVSKYGTLVTSGDEVVAFSEKPELRESLINGGFFVFDRRMFDYLSTDDSCVLEHDGLARLARDGQLMTYRHRGYWQCMDTPRDVKQLNDEWQTGAPGWVAPETT